MLRILTAIAARLWKFVPLLVLMSNAYGHCDCCEVMHTCVGVRVWACARRMLTVVAARRNACVCGSVCLGLYKAHAQCDCCEAMHACVGVCDKAHGHRDL
jgi:hypothetical protein